MSSPTEEKSAVFSEWTISEKSDGLESQPEIWKEDSEVMLDDDLHPAEREFRRKSRAFAVAAAQKRAGQDGRNEQKSGLSQREKNDKDRRKKTEREQKSDGLQPKRITSPPKSSAQPSPSSASSPGDSTRTKRKSSAKAEAANISSGLFENLAFYYIPNAELGPRKLRIAKARQHGAQWVQQITKATHVIVDKDLSWKDIQVVLRDVDRPADESWPFVFVNEEYPLDCISYRRILNPDQKRYYIRGSPEFKDTKKSPALPMSSPAKTNCFKDMQIKPGSHRRHRSTTPPPAEDRWKRPRKGEI